MTISGIILDMDGVLWRGEQPLPGLQKLFKSLRALELPFVLATNNATKTPAQYEAKLQRFGVTVAPEQILTSPGAAVGYLRERFPEGTPVYAVGERGLHEALREAGFDLVGPDQVRAGVVPPVVVGGLTTHNLSYELLATASLLVRGGAAFVATNGDLTYPSERGPLPGAGAILSVIAQATGVPPTVVGKPHRAMFDEALRRLHVPPARVLMVGDRLDTDIVGAQAAGLRTALVLTGITRREDLVRSEVQPDLVLSDLDALGTWLIEQLGLSAVGRAG
jgi:4-nitrophenyl phosphatase